MTLKKSRKEYIKEYNLKNREKKKEYMKEYNLKNREKNREKIKEYGKKYRLKNREKIKEYRLKNKERQKEWRKEYGLKNKEYLSGLRRGYYLKNREQNIKYQTKYHKYKYQTDINFRLLKICSSRTLKALKGFDKSASTMKLLGCTSDELRKHIESLFEPWMTWENQGRGGWDIDHIKACFHFNLADPEQQRACFNWSNLQPLEHIANIKKGAG